MTTKKLGNQKLGWPAFSLVSVALSFFAGLWAVGGLGASEDPIRFDNVQTQARQFIEYEQSIKLTPEQEAVKRAALEAIPAACCSDNNAYTCCCPCNYSKTVWGLSAYLITRHGSSAEQVRAKALEWQKFVNPGGFSGDACYTGGCGLPFNKGGCGGMNASRLIF